MPYPNDANGDVFRRMEASGFDFNERHDVEFFAIFPSEEAADAVARQYAAEHKASDHLANVETQPSTHGGVELIIVKPMLVTYENVAACEARLAARVAEYGGRMDGWGVMQPSDSVTEEEDPFEKAPPVNMDELVCAIGDRLLVRVPETTAEGERIEVGSIYEVVGRKAYGWDLQLVQGSGAARIRALNSQVLSVFDILIEKE